MSSDITVGGVPNGQASTTSPKRRLVQMRIGEAEVYVAEVGGIVEVEPTDEIYTVAPDPKQAFDKAVEVVRECVRVVGTQLESLAKQARPQEIEVEFSLTFDARARGALIPIFVTAEQGLETGLKVKAVWKFAQE